jgi:hypothetical protein
LPLGVFPERAAFSPDSERLVVSGSAEGGVTASRSSPSIWDARRGVELRPLAITNGDVAQFDPGLAWSPDGRFVLLVSVKGPMLFDAESGQAIPAFEGHERWAILDEQVEAWLLARRLGRKIPALRPLGFDVDF